MPSVGGDLEHLLLTDPEHGGRAIRRKILQSKIGKNIRGTLVHRASIEDTEATGKFGKEEVFGKTQRWQDVEFLLNDLNTELLSMVFRFWRIFNSCQAHRTLGWLGQTSDHFAKGAFACTVCTD